MKIDINYLLKDKLGLRLDYKSNDDICYTSGTRILYINSTFFEYKNKISGELLPITADIQLAVDLIRSEVLGIEPKYELFSEYDIRKGIKINEKYQKSEM